MREEEEIIFATAIRDETFRPRRHGAAPVEERFECGFARTRLMPGGMTIIASDDFASMPVTAERPGGEIEQLLTAAAELDAALLARMGAAFGECAELRVVRRARFLAAGETSILDASTFVIATSSGGRRVVLPADGDRFEIPDPVSPARQNAVDPLRETLVWKEGSGAVLLHELVGHPAERGAVRPGDLPPWLLVHDAPAAEGIGRLDVDDLGRAVSKALLSGGEPPTAWRRFSFRDAPVRRMTNLVVAVDDAPFDLPVRRVEVVAVSGGRFDRLTDEVEIDVDVAFLVDESSRSVVAPFTLRAPRNRLIATLAGGRGAVQRYPGVICSDEGQKLPVGSFAPEIVTRRLAE